MKFIYFTDIHLCEGTDSRQGFAACLEAMLAHNPQLLINGGDLGINPEALALYDELIEDVPVPILHSNGNHEICSGYVPRECAGTDHRSADIDGVHFVTLDVVRYFEPTEAHPWNWHALADDDLLAWLAADLAPLNPQTPLIVASHVPLSTTWPSRMGQQPGMDFPTNEVAGADKILNLLKPFAHVATLHGHDHENCRHYVDHIEIMTTAAVSGEWWANRLDSRREPGREPQGYRLVEVGNDGTITSRYSAIVSEQNAPAEYDIRPNLGRRFVNVYDGSPQTAVEVAGVGALAPLDPCAESSAGLATHLYELPQGFDEKNIDVRIAFEDGRTFAVTLESQLGNPEGG